MKFQEISDSQWKTIQKHLHPVTKINRIPLIVILSSALGLPILAGFGRWTELPAVYGSKSTAYRRFQNLQEQGIWKKILSGIIKSAHKQGKLNLQKISVDSTTVPAKKEVI